MNDSLQRVEGGVGVKVAAGVCGARQARGQRQRAQQAHAQLGAHGARAARRGGEYLAPALEVYNVA